jgi:hypothetical protein
LAAVLLGLLQARQSRWLLERHRAERCRLAKFRTLLDTDLWVGGPLALERWNGRLDAARRAIESLTHASMHAYACQGEDWDVPPLDNAPIALDTLQPLVEHYRDRRIDSQLTYFAQRASRNALLDRATRHLPPALFFASVFAVLAHFVLDLLGASSGDPAWHATALVALAVALPVLGAGVRTFRTAHELARSATHFRARRDSLTHLRERIANETEGAGLLRIFQACENLLEAEHREWLRLMLEAEWFG